MYKKGFLNVEGRWGLCHCIWCLHLDGRRLDDGHLGVGSVLTAFGGLLNGLYHWHSLDNFSEDDVLSVKPRRLDGGDEELGPVGVPAGVGHRHPAGAQVLQLEVLVGELVTVDGLASGAVSPGEVSALEHKTVDDPVELGTLVAESLLAGSQSPEVLDGLGYGLAEQADDDGSLGLTPDLDVKRHLMGHLGPLWLAAAGGISQSGHDVDEEEDGGEERHLHDDLQERVGSAAAAG